jgi:hypothetical protein
MHSFHIRVVYDVEKERPSQEIWGSTFEKRKKTNFLLFLSKGKHRYISPPLGILLYNSHYVIVACAFTLHVLNETLERIIPVVYHLEPVWCKIC